MSDIELDVIQHYLFLNDAEPVPTTLAGGLPYNLPRHPGHTLDVIDMALIYPRHTYPDY